MRIRVKKVSPTAKLPTHGSEYAAGYDLYADLSEDLKIAPHTTVTVDTGLQMELPEGYFAGIFARSGIGVCDSDYRGNYLVAIHNDSETERTVTPHEKIAQMIVLPYLTLEFEEVPELSDTDRGAGGFGSTGK